MDDPPFIEIAFIFGLILLNGFFSMSEMAIVSARKARLKAKAEAGKKSYAAALDAAERPARFLSTIQIGITLIGTLAGAFGGATIARPLAAAFAGLPPIAPYAEALSVGLVVLTITVLSIVLGELVPKQLALARPEGVAAAVVPILNVISLVFRPLVSILSKTTNLILKLFRVSEADDRTITEEEIRITLLEGERTGIVAEQERSMVEGVFYLGDRPVETFMTHRSDLVWLEAAAGADEVRALVTAHPGLTWIPVAVEGPDDIVGVVSARDVLAALVDGGWKGLAPLLRTPCFIPGTMSALKAFAAFKRGNTQLLLVIDEYGGLAGALGLSDLVEEIVGVLAAPDGDGEEIVARADGSYLVGGLVNIDDFADLFGIVRLLPEQREYHTLAGFILETTGSIPRTGEVFVWEGFRFEIVDMDGNRIDKVIVTPPAPPAEPSDAAPGGAD
jgi:putative hemolysin